MTLTLQAEKRFVEGHPVPFQFSCSVVFFGKSDTFTNYFIARWVQQQLWTEIESYSRSRKIFTHTKSSYNFFFLEVFLSFKTGTCFPSIFCKEKDRRNSWNYTYSKNVHGQQCTLMCQVYMKYWISPAAPSSGEARYCIIEGAKNLKHILNPSKR